MDFVGGLVDLAGGGGAGNERPIARGLLWGITAADPCEFCEAEEAARGLMLGTASDVLREDTDATRFAGLGASRIESVGLCYVYDVRLACTNFTPNH